MLDTFAQFKSHLVQHLDKKRFQCPSSDCNELFKDVDLYLDHVQNRHQVERKSSGQILDDKPAHPESVLSSHTNFHNSQENVKTNIQRHQKRKKFECQMCKIIFSSRNSYENHMRLISHDSQHAKTCDITKNESTAKSNKKMNSKSEQVKILTCNICEKSFKSESYLKSHKLIHTGDLPFGCDLCSAKFNRKDKLKRHALLHGNNIRYECPFKRNGKCQKWFYRMDKLTAHIKRHGNIKLYEHKEQGRVKNKLMKCFECDENFKLEKLRRIHHENFHGIVHSMDGSSYKDICLPNKIENINGLKEINSLQQENIIVYIEPD